MTSIEWTHRPGTKGESWNPVVGCSIVSPGCTNCYAMRMAARLESMAVAENARRTDPHYGGKTFDAPTGHYLGTTQSSKAGPVWTGKVALAPDRVLTAPLKARAPRTYFVNSMGDLFHEDVPDEWIDRVFAVMALASHHTFLVLTKRAARMRSYIDGVPERAARCKAPVVVHWSDKERVLGSLRSDYVGARPWPLRNVWLGVSAERQAEAEERIPDLLETSAVVRFVSAEPLLGPIDFVSPIHYDLLGMSYQGYIGDPLSADHYNYGAPKINWIIVGGESGPGARPMHPDWARSIRDQCMARGVSFFFKQWGQWLPSNDDVNFEDGKAWAKRHFPGRQFEQHSSGHTFVSVGKFRAGRLLDGEEFAEWPEVRI